MSERSVRAPRLLPLVLAAAVAASGAGVAAQEAPATAAPARKSVGPGPIAPGVVPPAAPLRLLVFTFRNQRAGDALAQVRPLLSPNGSVALDESANSLSVRDTPAALARVAETIRDFDHSRREMSIQVQLIRAEVAKISPVPPSVGIDEALLNRLRQIFRYDSYVLLSRSRIDTREGEAVAYEMGDGYRLSFRSGTVVDGRSLRLAAFEMARAQAGKPQLELVRTAVNLRLDQPLVLGLSSHEGAGRALLLALRYEAPAAPWQPAVRVPAQVPTQAPGG